MAWRLAKSLETLRTQVNQAYPKRNKASDGTIGDAAHKKVASDHNPNAQGVVCALDLTNDPKNGLDAHALANTLITNRHSDLKYVISDRRIAGDWTGWKWHPYYGANPHINHIHVSVGRGADGKSTPPYDNTTKWVIAPRATKPSAPAQGGTMLTLNRARILAYGILGDLSALSGKRDPDLKKYHVGKKTTEQAVDEFYVSKEGKTWREKTLPKIISDRDHYQKSYQTSQKTIEELNKALSIKDNEIKKLKAQTGDAEANLLGRALIELLAKFGYKKV